MNIKGVFQIWTHDGGYHEVPLKEGHAWTREGCTTCPDFAAEHADISTGGIGQFSDWTLTIVRTDKGREVLDAMVADGAVETRPGDDDPGAIALMRKLATREPQALAAGAPSPGRGASRSPPDPVLLRAPAAAEGLAAMVLGTRADRQVDLLGHGVGAGAHWPVSDGDTTPRRGRRM